MQHLVLAGKVEIKAAIYGINTGKAELLD